jgi:hypothetical protein
MGLKNKRVFQFSRRKAKFRRLQIFAKLCTEPIVNSICLLQVSKKKLQLKIIKIRNLNSHKKHNTVF